MVKQPNSEQMPGTKCQSLVALSTRFEIILGRNSSRKQFGIIGPRRMRKDTGNGIKGTG